MKNVYIRKVTYEKSKIKYACDFTTRNSNQGRYIKGTDT